MRSLQKIMLLGICILICLKVNGIPYFYQNFDLRNGLSQMKVSAICEDKTGNIWIGTRNGLNKYNGKEIDNYYKENGLGSNRILALHVRDNNELIILTSEGLSFYDGQRFRNQPLNFPKVNYELIEIDEVIYISDFKSWMQYKDGSFQLIKDPPSVGLQLGNVQNFRIHQDSLVFVQEQGDEVLIDPQVQNILAPSYWFSDRQKNIWIGSDNGVHFFRKSYFEHIEERVLSNIWAMIEQDESYYFASYGKGLFEMSKRTGFVRNLPMEAKDKDFFNGIAEDGAGNLYFSNARSLVKFDGKNLSFIFDWNPTFAATFDSVRNCLVFGTYNGIMILQEDGSLDSVVNTNYIHPNNYIMNITIDRDGNYWLGSYKGLTKLNPDNFSSKTFSLPIGSGVFASFMDATGNIWLGGEKGLYLYDQQLNSIRLVESQLLHTQVNAIQEWDNRLIINTLDQLVLFDHLAYIKTKAVHTQFLNQSNSYPGLEPSFDGLYIDHNNEPWVISQTSLDILKVKSSMIANLPMQVRIKKIGNIFTKDIIDSSSSVDTVYLQDYQNINVVLEAIGYSRPQKQFYKYRLDDEPWSAWSNENSFTIKQLNHGVHLLKVALGPIDLTPNPQTNEIYIQVILPIYKRSFFVPSILSLLGVTLLSLSYFIWRNKTQKKKYNRQLEEARYLRSQLLLSQMNPHFLFNVLASIQNKILSGDKASANDKLIQLSKLMRNFLSSSYKSNHRQKGFENEITLSKEIDMLKSYIEFEKSISNDHFVYHIIYEGEESQQQIMIPPMLIQPYVENAIKHGLFPDAKGGKLIVHFTMEADGLYCRVTDNGVGFELSKKSIKSTKTHSSLGSILVSERVEILNQLGYNIRVNTESTIGLGTEILIKIIDKF